MTDGVWLTVTSRVLAGLVPQALEAVTLTVPDEVPTLTVMLLVPSPPVIVHPAGRVQMYEVAVATSATEYTCPVTPVHWTAEPVMVPGWEGADRVA